MTRNDGTTDLTTYYTYTTSGDGTLLGLVETVTDPNENVTSYTYYSNGLIEDIVSAESTSDEATTHYAYDSRDRLYTVTDGNGHTTTFAYDKLDQLTQRTDPDPDGTGTTYTSPVWNYFYDADGNRTFVTDPKGYVTETVYDVRDRPFQAIQPVADPAATPAVTTKEGTTGATLSGTWSTLTASGALNSNESASSGNGASYAYAFSGLNSGKKYASSSGGSRRPAPTTRTRCLKFSATPPRPR